MFAALSSTRSNSIKDALPDGPQDFDFDGDLGHFTLDDDTDPILLDRIVRDDLTPGTYTVSETVPPGWRLVGMNCSDVEYSGPSATIELEANEIVTCIFSNVQLGTITIIKDFIPDIPDDVIVDVGGGNVPLNRVVTAQFSFHAVEGTGAEPDPPDKLAFRDGETQTFGLAPGNYILRESDGAFIFPPFETLSIECTDPSKDTTVDLANSEAFIELAFGENVTCTFTNQLVGAIKIVKHADPQSTEEFEFVGLGDEIVFLSDATEEQRDAAPPGFDIPPAEHATLVSPGTYNVHEFVPADWFLNGIQCEERFLADPTPTLDNSTSTTVDVANGTAMIGVDPLEVVTCTFFNVQLPPDSDDDGLSDEFESGFGGTGVTVSGAGSVSATGDAESGSTITADDVTVALPPGATAFDASTEIAIMVSAVPPPPAISGVMLSDGVTKSIELPIGGNNAICIDDSPAATIESVATDDGTSPLVEVGVPATVGNALASGQYVVTRTSDTHVRVDGLTHSAVAMITSNSDDGDGNVTARVRFGFALIEGDGGDNAIRITRGSTSRSVVVTGIGTTINGQSGPVELGGILFGFSMDLKAGDDRVFFEGAGLPLIGGIVRTGSGNDLVRFDSFSAAGNPGLLFVDTGDDEDEIIVQNSLLPAVWFELGRDNDRVTALDSVFGGQAAVLTQAGDDAVVLEATHFREAALVALGSDNDSLKIGAPDDPTRAARFDEALALVGDAGFDALDAGTLSNPNAYGNVLGSPLVVGFEQIDS
jgi:hypothetical protein